MAARACFGAGNEHYASDACLLSCRNRMRIVVAVVQRKGGVGKTTIAVNLAGELHERGLKPVAIDADDQRSAIQWAEPGHLPFPVEELPITRGQARTWVDALGALQAEFLVVDTPPNDYAIGTVVAVANLVIVPCTPSGLDLEATVQSLAVVNAARHRRKQKIPVLLVPNRVDSRTLEGQQLADELASFGEQVGPRIGNRAAFIRAFSDGQCISRCARGSPSDLEIEALCDAVLESLPR
jgi:chromosome partitioning protein